MRIALVTGASSGMGREYVLLADRSKHYDEIWAVARRQDRLEALAKECTTPLRCISLDLTERESCQALQQEFALAEAAAKEKGSDFSIGYLANVAGFGKFGTYSDLSQREVDDMIDLNCRALVDLTQAAIPYMTYGSRILEFASSAAFQPLPGLAVYAASKSFVLSYTRALRWELVGRGIHATAVCPIWIKTEFIKVARDTENGKTVKHPWPQLSPKLVARWSTFVNAVNYPVATCSIFAFAMRIASKIIPAPIIMGIWEGLRRI